MYYYEKPNPDNSVKRKLLSEFPVINMKALQLQKVKNNICWRILENISEKHDDIGSYCFFAVANLSFFRKEKKEISISY